MINLYAFLFGTSLGAAEAILSGLMLQNLPFILFSKELLLLYCRHYYKIQVNDESISPFILRLRWRRWHLCRLRGGGRVRR